MNQYETSEIFTDLERLVIDYASKMTKDPGQIDEKLFASLREHFDEAQMVELTTTIAWENYRARFNHTLRIPSDGFTDGAVCAVPVRKSSGENH